MMKKGVLALVALMVLAFPVLGQTAQVIRLSGKVEVLPPRGAWTRAEVGQQFPIGATISTGFQSTAVLQVGSSQVTVLALTRMTVQELSETQTSVTTTLNLQTGKVRAQVKTAPGQVADFKLRSPVSTAAVRGTDFYFDGYRLQVIEGVTELVNRLGLLQYVTAGNGTETTGNDPPSNPEDDRAGGALVSTDTGGGAGGGGSVSGTTGSVVIVIQEEGI